MFGKLLKSAQERANELEERNDELEKEIEKLRKERMSLKDEVEDLKIQKKVSEEDIKHMTKMKEEKLDIAHQKNKLQLEQEKNEAVAKVKDEYRDKLEKRLETEVTNIKEMYGQILERLPNVNMRLKGEA